MTSTDPWVSVDDVTAHRDVAKESMRPSTQSAVTHAKYAASEVA